MTSWLKSWDGVDWGEGVDEVEVEEGVEVEGGRRPGRRRAGIA